MAERMRDKTGAAGVYKIHARGCSGGRCGCNAAFQANVYSARDGKKIRKHFAKQKEAELWRGELRDAVENRGARAPSRMTVDEAAETLLTGMRDGSLQNRSGHPYKPATIRRYEEALRLHVRPVLGRRRLTDVDRGCVKALVREWVRADMVPSSVRNNLDPLRVILREAIEDGRMAVDPMGGMRLPQGSGRRERVADRAEAQTLIDALPEAERALWACAFYGTLRRGELRAMRWSDVDFDDGVIRVRRGWDDKEGEQATKSDAGERDVPLAGILRKILAAHKLATGRGEEDLVLGRTAALPFVSSTIGRQARKAWGWKQVPNPEPGSPRMIWVKAREDALEPICLHEGRHSAASYLIEAGLNDLELTAMVGHSDSRTTKAIYGHLFPDSREKVTAKVDAYLEAVSG